MKNMTIPMRNRISLWTDVAHKALLDQYMAARLMQSKNPCRVAPECRVCSHRDRCGTSFFTA